MFTDILVPKDLQIHTYAVANSALSASDCDSIITFAENLTLEEGKVGESSTNKAQRAATIAWLPQSEGTKSIYGHLANVAKSANDDLYQFRLHGFSEQIQFSQYQAGAGHFDWHIDIGPRSQFRKLSMVVQLSKPEEYSGGDLQLKLDASEVTMPNRQGSVIIFPSYLLHRVTPVTKGLRRSLALWVSGPPFA